MKRFGLKLPAHGSDLGGLTKGKMAKVCMLPDEFPAVSDGKAKIAVTTVTTDIANTTTVDTVADTDLHSMIVSPLHNYKAALNRTHTATGQGSLIQDDGDCSGVRMTVNNINNLHIITNAQTGEVSTDRHDIDPGRDVECCISPCMQCCRQQGRKSRDKTLVRLLHCLSHQPQSETVPCRLWHVTIVITVVLFVVEVLLLAYLLHHYFCVKGCLIPSQKLLTTPESRLSPGWSGDVRNLVSPARDDAATGLLALIKRDHQRILPQNVNRSAAELGSQSHTQQMQTALEDATFHTSILEHVKQRFQNAMGSSAPLAPRMPMAVPPSVLHHRSVQQQPQQQGHWSQLVEEEKTAFALEQERDISPAVAMSLSLLLRGRLHDDAMHIDHSIDVEYDDEDVAGHVERQTAYDEAEDNLNEEDLPRFVDDPVAASNKLAADWETFRLAEALTAPPLDVNLKQRPPEDAEDDLYDEFSGEIIAAANGSSLNYYDIESYLD